MSLHEATRALIVEDDPMVARSVARRLLREGYTVNLAQSCRAARAAGAGFDVATLDLDLPDGNGAELASELVRLGSVRHVVFFTGSLDPIQRARAAALGAVIDKTSDLEELMSALAPLVGAPTSQLAPAQRAWSRQSSPRLNRGSVEDEDAPDLAEVGSSRR
jgi:DNA-binding response OmpR family regulator